MLLFNDEDKRELLEEVSIYNVCDFLGIEYQNTGCRKSILCPDHLNHNDQHYGSCFIYENTNTAHCFVCNKSFDTIDLLRLNGYGYYDALCQLANLSGSLSRFEKQPDKKQFWLPNLTKEERELIGLYPTKRIKLYYAIQENKPDDTFWEFWYFWKNNVLFEGKQDAIPAMLRLHLCLHISHIGIQRFPANQHRLPVIHKPQVCTSILTDKFRCLVCISGCHSKIFDIARYPRTGFILLRMDSIVFP